MQVRAKQRSGLPDTLPWTGRKTMAQEDQAGAQMRSGSRSQGGDARPRELAWHTVRRIEPFRRLGEAVSRACPSVVFTAWTVLATRAKLEVSSGLHRVGSGESAVASLSVPVEDARYT